MYIIDLENNINLQHQTTNLCLIPRFRPHSSTASNCAKYLRNGTNISNSKDFCKFHCVPKPNHSIVKQVLVNKCLLTNFDSSLLLHCEGKKHSTQIPPIDYGTLKINLPSNCKVFSQNEVLIDTTYPRESRDIAYHFINHLIPNI